MLLGTACQGFWTYTPNRRRAEVEIQCNRRIAIPNSRHHFAQRLRSFDGAREADSAVRSLAKWCAEEGATVLRNSPDAAAESVGMRRYLDPKNDVVFKSLFATPARGHLLIALLTAVLKPNSPIRVATVLNPKIPRELPRNRSVVLDIRVVLDDRRQVDVEMQVQVRKGASERFLYYWAKLYGDQLEPSDPYDELKPCVSILFLGEQLLPGERFHGTFRVSEIHDHHDLTDRLELHTIELCKLEHAEAGDALTAWGQFFHATSDEEQETLAMTLPEIHQATAVLKELSADEKLRQEALDRELNEAAYRIEMGAARAEGRAEGHREGEAIGLEVGRAEGRAEGLRTSILSMTALLGIALDAVQRQKLEAMNAQDLEQLAARILSERQWPGAE